MPEVEESVILLLSFLSSCGGGCSGRVTGLVAGSGRAKRKQTNEPSDFRAMGETHEIVSVHRAIG